MVKGVGGLYILDWDIKTTYDLYVPSSGAKELKNELQILAYYSGVMKHVRIGLLGSRRLVPSTWRDLQ